ncbi:hypothetical protein HPB47_027246 [Ixodes persulcatus]|uniref:Uncharacterized protein n=1 Tax=Ixodes persulcatus TaxID=34615 RepID=A0AC60PWI5_IXOPE|nr:hypothetical protein HPB47_027246 [Ixodes persulcatus]
MSEKLVCDDDDDGSCWSRCDRKQVIIGQGTVRRCLMGGFEVHGQQEFRSYTMNLVEFHAIHVPTTMLLPNSDDGGQETGGFEVHGQQEFRSYTMNLVEFHAIHVPTTMLLPNSDDGGQETVNKSLIYSGDNRQPLWAD